LIKYILSAINIATIEICVIETKIVGWTDHHIKYSKVMRLIKIPSYTL